LFHYASEELKMETVKTHWKERFLLVIQSIIEEAVKLQKADVPTDEKQNQKQHLLKRFEKLATTNQTKPFSLLMR